MEKEKQPFAGTVKIGSKGQIVIPKEARDLFDLKPGDSLVLFAHPERGIVLANQSVLAPISAAIFDGKQIPINRFTDELKKKKGK